jgi:transposase-like protein
MAVIPDFRSETLLAFLKDNVAPGSTVYTDGLKSFTGLKEAGFQHMPRNQPPRTNLRKGAKSVVPLADRAIGNLQQWLLGTYHGVSRDQLRFTWTNSYFVTIGEKHRWRRSKRCSDLELGGNLLNMRRYGAHPTWVNRPPSVNHYLLGVTETTG